VAAVQSSQFTGRRNGDGKEFLVLTESFVKAVARKKTWVVVLVDSGKKAGEKQKASVWAACTALSSCTWLENAQRQQPSVWIQQIRCAVHTKLSHLGQSLYLANEKQSFPVTGALGGP
jgi:hypothetical protein